MADSENAVRRRWEADFDHTAAQIPEDWIFTHPDGWVGIDPSHCTCSGSTPRARMRCLVCLYRGLLQVGYARGWL